MTAEFDADDEFLDALDDLEESDLGDVPKASLSPPSRQVPFTFDVCPVHGLAFPRGALCPQCT